MHPERQVLGFLIRGALSEERLLESVARAFSLAPGGASRFDVDSPAGATVLVETTLRRAGFRTDITLYVDASRASATTGLTSLEVARSSPSAPCRDVLLAAPRLRTLVKTAFHVIP
ncbi:hypothetical protein [Stigmatella aurantiaca]|uniref:Uncharacterized protein n=1 Tax=Stigmatella aurantiaca (strain DW4/3-1) TaxID=378806 RepID=E3FWK4_STIAD|nr:hypothetical protein [Stigmatella aurantiaca]ADO68517.1 uncharacterized protein STAUR_0713 [Stigmatella aurantiaca DW4/3-1]